MGGQEALQAHAVASRPPGLADLLAWSTLAGIAASRPVDVDATDAGRLAALLALAVAPAVVFQVMLRVHAAPPVRLPGALLAGAVFALPLRLDFQKLAVPWLALPVQLALCTCVLVARCDLPWRNALKTTLAALPVCYLYMLCATTQLAGWFGLALIPNTPR